jgi:FKBP-type peptidyl-prolyl cis-trans isomerase (trigger factor)
MDTPLKLKIKVGEHEFEGEGPADIVQAQFGLFKEMIAAVPIRKPQAESQQEEKRQELDTLPHQPIEKVMKAEGRVISLTAKCDTVDEAVLLILLGQKDFRNNQEVTGSEIMDGLKQSGYQIDRVDRVTDKLSEDGDMITVGIHRGRRYRLTNQGLAKALTIVKELIATVP